jgi:hypothetical protein
MRKARKLEWSGARGLEHELLCENLTPLTMMDQLLCIGDGRGPIKTCSERLADQSLQSSMVATGASMDFLQNLYPFFLRDALLKQFLLHVLTHKLPLDKYIVLATLDKVLHLNFVMGNVYRREIPCECLSPVTTTSRTMATSWSAGGFSSMGFSSSLMDDFTRS